ncbi:DnaJ domain-containing protein [Hirschfeldia incana]|nr:DnaJ domain-containing protein [Hirschfeldia incana]
MECNRDEALRAKEIAENKFKMRDFSGAKKFALKAQSLYPEMEGVPQMLSTFDVFIAAETRVNGEVDWYGILDANPRDDNETLKKKYRKLALMLHPDKNSSVGADGAFKHVSEAWKFLSDKEKRGAYDRKRSLYTMYTKVSVSSSNSGFCNFANVRPPPPPPSQKKNNPPPPTQKSNPQKPAQKKTGQSDHHHHHTTAPNSFVDTFWTVCRRCMTQYEYLRIYINCNLLCANCLQSFSAVQVPKPGVLSSHWSRVNSAKTKSADAATSSGVFNNSKWTFSRTSSAAHARSVVQQTYEKVKKDREEAEATGKRGKKNAKRKCTATDSSGSSLKKRKVVIGETESGGSGGRKIVYYVTAGETGRNMGKLHVTAKERASPRLKKKISKEAVTREVKSR